MYLFINHIWWSKMKKPLVILKRFADSESFYRDIEKIKKLSTPELIKIMEFHLDYENNKSIVEAKLEEKFKGEKLDLARQAAFLFGVLFQEGFKRLASVEDYIEELKLLGFEEKIIIDIKKVLDVKLKKMIDDAKKIERPLLNGYCDFRWRIIKVRYDWTRIQRESLKIEMMIYTHPPSGEHNTIIFEMTPLEFEKFLEEIDIIKRELKNVR